MPAKRPEQGKPSGPCSIGRDEVMPLREAARRLGWGWKTISQAQKDGLRTVPYGRMKYVLGADVIAFFDRLAERDEA